ncbi:SPOSA6832_01550 [Sporobolomyces salmonicolor]|uniref:SPOSA6832_01550-mRNA-1:cds n=1 Tax=Sporidiobolus salmonicolor TaxID=5005 RepID=A0A0D6EJP0_SPOSA|nr:SPOSA6832_01550 [Sporobolomyces salmonicolor]
MSSSSVAAKVTATLVGAAHATITATLPAAPSQSAAAASIFDPSHPSPVKYSASDPLVLFIVQAAIIVGFSRILHFFLRYLRQPRVISEVIAGILIGPSAFGRIPGFTSSIFPSPSIPNLNLVANLGLVLFLFLVGLEVDFSLFRRNVAVSSSISFIGMVIPFGLGAAVSKGLYDTFVEKSKNYGTFLLFIGTANAITAFPVLARILTDENLLQNHVGVIVLSAGVGNDVVGWILLALAIALVNASSGIVVLYVILTSIAWILVLWFIGRPALIWLGRKTRSFGEAGPSQAMTVCVVFLVLASAFLTDRIGMPVLHAIFGAFLVGLIVPKQIRHRLTEKIEDLVTVLFLPLYFALSGLNTDLSLLSDGSIWGWTVCVIVVAFASKFLACGAVAKGFGMDWRESGAVGSLMGELKSPMLGWLAGLSGIPSIQLTRILATACKGLVELIVLNIGLSAGILNNQIFAMFVLMALVTTFITTPLTLAFYPVSYRLKKDRERRALTSTTFGSLGKDDSGPGTATSGDGVVEKPLSRFAVVLEQFDHLPALMAFLRLVKAPSVVNASATAAGGQSASDRAAAEEKSALALADDSPASSRPVFPAASNTPSLSALRLVALTDRTSALLRAASSTSALLRADSLSSVLRSFAAGLGISVHSRLSIVNHEGYVEQVAQFVEESESEMLVLPWALEGVAKAGEREGDDDVEEIGVVEQYLPNPFEGLFGVEKGSKGTKGGEAAEYAAFARKVFAQASCDVALFLDRSSSASSTTMISLPTSRSHLFLPFYGGSDDRLCLSLLIQLVASNPGLTATVLRLTKAAELTADDRELEKTGTKLSYASTDGTDASFQQPVEQGIFTIHGAGGAAMGDTMYPTVADQRRGEHGLASETQDDVCLAHYFSSPDSPRSAADGSLRRRIDYSTVSTSQPLHYAMARIVALSTSSASTSTSPASAPARPPLVVLAGRARFDAPSHAAELAAFLKVNAAKVQRSIAKSSEVRRALGETATGCVVAGVGDAVWVVQRRGKGGTVKEKDV